VPSCKRTPAVHLISLLKLKLAVNCIGDGGGEDLTDSRNTYVIKQLDLGTYWLL
jgi:hypothetical protein